MSYIPMNIETWGGTREVKPGYIEQVPDGIGDGGSNGIFREGTRD